MKPISILAVFMALVSAFCESTFVDIPAWRKAIKHPKNKRGKKHTLDLFNAPAPGCTPYQMDTNQRRAIVKIHNDLRRKVAKGDELRGLPAGPQPMAKDMNKLVYDEDLEKVAIAWISQCKRGSDGLRDIDPYFFVGQNAYMEASTSPLPNIDWKNPINSWYDEVRNFNPKDVPRYRGKNPLFNIVVGHYAQIVNAKTKRIGCAQATYEDVISGTTWYTRRVVCNYGEGVMIDAPLYEIGNPCIGKSATCDDGLVV